METKDLVIYRMETRAPKRRDVLIANFVKGSALGWKMYVPEAFKAALDIKLLPRIIDKKTEMVWTQGDNYDFHIGDVFYSNEGQTTNSISEESTLSVQIQSVSSTGFVDAETTSATTVDGGIKVHGSNKQIEGNTLSVVRLRMDQGYIRFLVLQRNDNQSWQKKEDIECTQEQFVVFLQTGIVRTNNKKLINLFGS
ncbi:MAG: hypothetical protein HRT92_10065 [Piscirickettsiaceae bacterium]|nr:hypothetical protein [Piscirickettsiaceae bacterium]